MTEEQDIKKFNPWKDGKDGFSIMLSKSELIQVMKTHNMTPGQLVNYVMGSIMESLAPMIDNMLIEEKLLENKND